MIDMGVGKEKKLNPAGLVNIRVPISRFVLRHPLVHAAVNGKPVSLGFQNIAGPRDRPRRSHEFDFHAPQFLPAFLCASYGYYFRFRKFDQGRCPSLEQSAIRSFALTFGCQCNIPYRNMDWGL